jgi:hypothetical protein
MVRCATFHMRPVFEDEPTAWVCIACYPEDECVTGVGSNSTQAKNRCAELLHEAGVSLETFEETVDPELRRDLLWTLKLRMMMDGHPVTEVDPPSAALLAPGNGSGRERN